MYFAVTKIKVIFRFPGTTHFLGVSDGGYPMPKKISKIYKKHIYSENITCDTCKLSYMYNFHYIRVAKGLWIIILLKFLNYLNPRVMYYH